MGGYQAPYKSSIFGWDLPWNKPSSYWGTSILGTPHFMGIDMVPWIFHGFSSDFPWRIVMLPEVYLWILNFWRCFGHVETAGGWSKLESWKIGTRGCDNGDFFMMISRWFIFTNMDRRPNFWVYGFNHQHFFGILMGDTGSNPLSSNMAGKPPD